MSEKLKTMLVALEKEQNRTRTENLAATFASTQSDCLDLFATIGALREQSESEIETRFMRAYTENPDLAMKILFFARDVRGGLGERRAFRCALRWTAMNKPLSVRKNLSLIPEYGRFDDLLVLQDTPCEPDMLAFVTRLLSKDLEALQKGEEVSLLAKWLPSINASSRTARTSARKIAKALKMRCVDYRRTISLLRGRLKIVENPLRTKDYTFDYGKLPSKAMLKYRKAFLRNDNERYSLFLQDARSGKANLNTGCLTPSEIVQALLGRKDTMEASEIEALETTWKALEEYTRQENALVVVDGSGSMYWGPCGAMYPAAVALSLAIYYAERNRGVFRNHFITFSENPRLVEIKGENIADKVRYCESFNEVANTNIQKVFELILDAAVKNGVPQSEMPGKVYIISDMEFDDCTEAGDLTNFEYAKKLFAEHGYRLPDLVFWNVQSRNRQQPVTMNEQGVALVSGRSPILFNLLQSGELSPMGFMMDMLNSERYRAIIA